MGITVEIDDARMNDPAIAAAVARLRDALGPEPADGRDPEAGPLASLPAWVTHYQSALAGLPAGAKDFISLVIETD